MSATPRGRPPLSVGIVLANNFTLSAFSLFVDHLRLAADEGDGSRPLQARWTVMSERSEPVRASCGVAVGRTAAFLDPRRFDYVAVVGGILHAGPQIDDATAAYLRRVASAGVPLIGLCTGSFILCRLGLMQARRVCVSWYHHGDFVGEFPEQEIVADRLFVEDGDRITCAGGTGTADLATHLIERHLGRGPAQKASQVLMVERARAGDEVQPHPVLAGRVVDARLRRALLLMEQHLTAPLSIAAIAARLSLSTRQLERMFRLETGRSPAALYRAMRLFYAGWLLENTQRSVTAIAHDAGFADCAHFSRNYKEAHGRAPSRARQPRAARPSGTTRAASRTYR